MTTADAARLAHCTIQNIQAHIKHGNLPAIKIGRDWQIDKADFDKWLSSPRKAGRPRKENAMYQVNYATKRGGQMSKFFNSISSLETEIIRLFRRHVSAKATRDGKEIGAVWKDNNKWNWFVDTSA